MEELECDAASGSAQLVALALSSFLTETEYFS